MLSKFQSIVFPTYIISLYNELNKFRYPVILTLENHCSIENSDKMAETIIQHLSRKIIKFCKLLAYLNFFF